MESIRVVITGINGFVGHHLARELSQNGVTVIGIGRESKITAELADIVKEYYVANLIEEWPPIDTVDAVIHLAGLAAVGASFDNPQLYINANSAMVTHMCEYYTKQEKKPRILVVSSGAIYNSRQPMPITEDSSIDFSSPYAISKVLTENQCTYYHNRGLDCIIVRPFNHIGPGQIPGFILPDFYERLSGIDPTATIKVGNINTRRDYTDVRDVARAYTKIILSKSPSHTIYNICSGASLSGKEILDKLKAATEKPDVQFEIDPSLVRPTDVMDIYGDSSRLQKEFDWKPTYSIDDTVRDFVAYERSKKAN